MVQCVGQERRERRQPAVRGLVERRDQRDGAGLRGVQDVVERGGRRAVEVHFGGAGVGVAGVVDGGYGGGECGAEEGESCREVAGVEGGFVEEALA